MRENPFFSCSFSEMDLMTSSIFPRETKCHFWILALMSMQNKILQITQFKNIWTNINKLYKEFGILKLKDLYKFNICCIVHKFIHFPSMLPDAVGEMFCTNAQVHNYDT